MQLDCPHCHALLEFTDKRPLFCAYCGQALSGKPPENLSPVATVAGPSPEPANSSIAIFEPEAATLAPSRQVAGEGDVDPEALGGYRLLRVLGAGGMGKVYEAEDYATGRRVALKLISGEYVTSKETVERFRQEGRLASMVDHPRCVFVLAADEEAGRPYIVMELMPGSTLQDLLKEKGALPPGEAVAKILDVIEGLEEAHQLGVVHRDVKPSNCFLDTDGRVKIGDFGLSKSLVSTAHLTRTGAFMGTPLYAAPEQVRGEKVDPQIDVYAVAATLYCLLTGQAPFQSGDAAATLARIVADEPPSMRSLRPGLSATLDRAVLRGLERDRSRRWRNLADFRLALLPLAPGRLSFGGLAARFAAYLVDLVVCWLLAAIGEILYVLVTTGDSSNLMNPEFTLQFGFQAIAPVVFVLYFTLLEGIGDCSLGKRLLRLRVRGEAGSDPPGLGRALGRIGVFYPLVSLGKTIPLALFYLAFGHQGLSQEALAQMYLDWRTYAISFAVYPLYALGIGLVVSTMRARNGYRGLHEFASGTRVIGLPRREKRRRISPHRLAEDVRQPEGLVERLGHFAVRGVLAGGPKAGVLLGEDPALGRQVILDLRPLSEPSLPGVRREVSRSARLRWLAGGRDGDRQWETFLAPAGSPLPELVSRDGRLQWKEVRPLLEELTEELSAACADGTLPQALTVDQVWVQPNGRVQLLDEPLTGPGLGQATAAATSLPDTDRHSQERALDFLANVATFALEGQPRPAGNAEQAPAPLRAPLPGHAVGPLSRLLRVEKPYEQLKQWQQDLTASRDQPAEVSRPRRIAHLAVLTGLLIVGLSCMGVGGCRPSLEAVESSQRIKRAESALRTLQTGAARDFAVANLSADPTWRLRAFAQLDADLRLKARLEQAIAELQHEHEARVEALSPWSKWYAATVDAQQDQYRSMAERGQSLFPVPVPNPANFRRMADRAAFAPPMEPLARSLAMTALVVIAPAIWVIWAFLTRGGFSFRMTGISLVQGEGRKAKRLRCAWRALLVWLPVVTLLGGAIWLEALYWHFWKDGETRMMFLWLSWTIWWLGMALLPLYLVLAIWRPTRSLHDRLAGTCLVPR